MRHEEQIKQGFKQTLDEPIKETILRDMKQVGSMHITIYINYGYANYKSECVRISMNP